MKKRGIKTRKRWRERKKERERRKVKRKAGQNKREKKHNRRLHFEQEVEWLIYWKASSNQHKVSNIHSRIVPNIGQSKMRAITMFQDLFKERFSRTYSSNDPYATFSPPGLFRKKNYQTALVKISKLCSWYSLFSRWQPENWFWNFHVQKRF